MGLVPHNESNTGSGYVMAKEIGYEEVIKDVPVERNVTMVKVDPRHLLQVIRDMDRRITDLERKLEQKNVT